ncbi:MAG: cytochrome c oxidase assembly protein [Solirubrobacterales bacterium]|nr:cytochrome c oxidase assembly protein [Solirubrobacterales bacterium]
MVLAAAADSSWTFAPGPIALIVLVTYLYVRRWSAVRADPRTRDVSVGRLVAFLGAMLVLGAALISPLDRLGEQLFLMHMVQHVLILDLVPILLMLSLTKGLMRPITRRVQVLERRAGFLAHPGFAVVLYVVTMAVWHIPALYDLALENRNVHVLEHILFLNAGLLYWWHLLSPIRSRISIGPFGPVVYMLVTKLFVSFIGIAITFAPTTLYDFYARAPRVWGLTEGDDQAVAGAIMAIEQSVVMGIALAYLFVRALAESEKESEREERFGAP